MSQFDLNNHAAFREATAVALAGGLSAAEQAAFDAHRAACAQCAAEFERAREADAHMASLFMPTRPAAGFEDRVIQRFRELAPPSPRRIALWRPNLQIHSALGKAVAGVAAAIVLGGIGYGVNSILNPPSDQWNDMNAAAQWGEFTSGKNLSSANQNPYPGTASAGAGIRLNMAAGEELGLAGDGSNRASGIGEGLRGGLDPAKPPAQQEQGGQQGQQAQRGHTVNFADGHVRTSGRDALGDAGGASAANEGKTQLGRDVVTLQKPPEFGRQQEHGWFKPTELGKETEARGPAAAGSAVVSGQAAAGRSTIVQELPAVQAETSAPAAEPVAGNRGVHFVRAGGEEAVVLSEEDAAPARPATPQSAKPPAAQVEPATRRVIRNGEMSFEVDRFDSAFAQVSKLATESGGYVGTSSSQKLPNGKVQGKVTVRVPPDRLDTLVLQLRGIGDLTAQSLEAQDVSKSYTDLESQLRAARAMEERLITIIKEGKGQIKDLLAAEKELGVWRTKVEELVGQIRFYDNQVALATLNVTLTERDISTPATARESENVDAGIESDDVEKARAGALKAIEEAKGRVVQSELKRYDAGQFGATIVADVPPDAAGTLLDRLKQLGKVARLDVQRKQTADDTKPKNTATNAPVRVERRDTRFNLSIYNLANVAPRQTATLSLAADDVEQAYQAILDRVTKAGGRILSSNLNRQKPEQTTGTIAFEVPSGEADAVTNDLRAAGEALALTVAANPDVQNVTTAKRGFNVSIISTAAVTPRETATIHLAAIDVAQARERILSVATTQPVHVRAAQLNENDRQNVTASLELDVKRAALPAVETALADAGQVIKRTSSRAADADNTLDSKIRLSLTLVPADRLPPRETTTLTVELKDVEAAMASLQAAASESNGRVVVSNLQKDRDGRGVARVAVDVPLDKGGEIVRRAREVGVVRAIDASKDLQVPPGALARARVDVTFANADTLVAPERGVFASIRRGLSTSLLGLMRSLELIIIGVCFVLPWALVLYAAWRLIKRRRATQATPAPAGA